MEWAHSKSWGIASPINKCTHDRGSTLNLVFTNISRTQCNIEEHLHITFDHETLLTKVPYAGLDNPSGRPSFKLTPEIALRFANGVKENMPSINILLLDPELLSESIIKCRQNSMQRFLRQKQQTPMARNGRTENAQRKRKPIGGPED